MKVIRATVGRWAMMTACASALALLAGEEVAAKPAAGAAGEPHRVGADYVFQTNVALGAPGLQDYLTFDSAARRLYVSHADRVTVVDVHSEKVVGSIGPFHDSHGVAIVSKLGKGYADSGDDGVVKVFNLSNFQIVKEVKVSPDADGMAFDDKTGSVLVVAGDSRNLTVIDSSTDAVVRTVNLPGKPEFLASDHAGHVFVNIADKGSVAKIDIATGRVLADWPLTGCKAPHGLAYDRASRRLFSGCANSRLVVVDAANGHNLANLPIGAFSDSVVVDSRRGLALVGNSDTMTVIQEDPGDRYRVARTIPTFFGGRSIGIDPTTGAVFVAHGHMKIESSLADLMNLRFGWDGVDIAVFEPAH